MQNAKETNHVGNWQPSTGTHISNGENPPAMPLSLRSSETPLLSRACQCSIHSLLQVPNSLLKRILYSQDSFTHRKRCHGMQYNCKSQTYEQLSAASNSFWFLVCYLELLCILVFPKSAARKLIKGSKHSPAKFYYCCCFNKTLFFRAVYIHRKMECKVQIFPHLQSFKAGNDVQSKERPMLYSVFNSVSF